MSNAKVERNTFGDYQPQTQLGEIVLNARKNGIVQFNGENIFPDSNTHFYTIIGQGHTRTKARYFHQSLNSHFGWNQIHLEPIEIFDLDAAMEDLIGMGIRGVTVTVPLKEQAYSYIAQHGIFRDAASQISGAVNTIVNSKDGLLGFNTDVDGFVGAFNEAEVNLNGVRAVVVGCGGMGRAAITGFGLNQAREVRLFDTDLEKAKKTVEEFSEKFPNTDFKVSESIDDALNEIEVVAQCAHYVTNFSESPIPSRLLKPSMAVVDAIYVPLEPPFIQDAEKIGCRKIIRGHKLVTNGGVEQIQHYLGRIVNKNLIAEMLQIGEKAILKALSDEN